MDKILSRVCPGSFSDNRKPRLMQHNALINSGAFAALARPSMVLKSDMVYPHPRWLLL